MAEKYKLFHSTDNEKIIISKTPIQQIDLLSELLKTVSLTDDKTRKYNLRQRNGKKCKQKYIKHIVFLYSKLNT